MKLLFIVFFGILVGLNPAVSQNEINQTDANGKRHGIWEKKYPNSKQLRYRGQFEHGKEIGTFSFYCEDCKNVPSVIKEFNTDTNISKVTYFTSKGKKVSEGEMNGKDRVGEWVYYHKKGDDIMTRENYKAGKLHGPKTVYYPDGRVAEETTYKEGLLHGENKYYAPNGTLLKALNYANDKMEGLAVYYDEFGKKSIEGNYKDDKKHGVWKYYTNGKLDREETFPKPLKKAQ